MPTDDAPKSAYELAMERLRKKDREEGVEERALMPAQRDAIAEARKVAEARLAEQEILHSSRVRGVLEPEAREALELEYRRDRERILSDRDRKIDDVCRGKK
jgi:hypothetical protein